MCILLLWRQEANELIGRYKFILAANRDEVFYRPAKPACYWLDQPHILAGEDRTEGYEGGTWIGVSKPRGRIGVLTNIKSITPSIDQTKGGRGKLIPNYLSTADSPLEYLKAFQQEAYTYRPFNLLVGYLTHDLYYMNNAKGEHPLHPLKKGYICVTNDVFGDESLKSQYALKLFENTLQAADVDDIHTSLFDVLQDTKTNVADTNTSAIDEYISSIFIPLSKDQHGTRTHTIITVDVNDHVTFKERTKLELNDSPDKWLESSYEFNVSK